MNWNYVGAVVGGTFTVTALVSSAYFFSAFLSTGHPLNFVASDGLFIATILSATITVYNAVEIFYDRKLYKETMKKYRLMISNRQEKEQEK